VASDLFADFATWLKLLLPGCIVSKKEGTLRIVNKIKEMIAEQLEEI